jgi:hypothetical protein
LEVAIPAIEEDEFMGTVASRVLTDVLSLRAYGKARSPVSEEPLGPDDLHETRMYRRVRFAGRTLARQTGLRIQTSSAVQTIHHLNDTVNNLRWLATLGIAWSTTCG